VFEAVGMMMEGPREKEKDNGKNTEKKRFFIQKLSPRKPRITKILAGKTPPPRGVLFFIFALFAPKGQEENFAGLGRDPRGRKGKIGELASALHISKM
jgi:hypothetical protein